MKSLKIESLWVTIEPFVKKVKQWKHYLPVINLFLLIGVVSLAIVCVLLVYYPSVTSMKPDKEEESISGANAPLPPLRTDARPIHDYDPIVSNNPFSPNRTGWAPPEAKTEPTMPGSIPPEEGGGQPVEDQPKPRGTPTKITLRGILILGNIRKALVENPDQTSNKKPFVFIEEGEEIAGYKVKNIEPDRVKLDWYGEEQIVVMRSNIKK